MSRVLLLWVLFSCLFLAGCINPALDVESRSLSEACLGASIGARTSGSITNAGEASTVGAVRYRWVLSADELPSTDDVALLGSSADVTLGPLAAGQSVALTGLNLIIPSTARLGPQFLMLIAVDLGDTDAGVGFSATPITINQCPSAGACDATYSNEAAYLASPGLSRGPQPYGRNLSRPVFLADKSTLPVRGLTVGGTQGTRGLLLRYRADRSFWWGKSLSGCITDAVDSAAAFNDGTLAVVTSSYTRTRQETTLSAYTQAGSLLWKRAVFSKQSGCTGSCGLTFHGVVAVDPSDDTAVVAASDHLDGVVHLVRVDRHGNELQRQSHAGTVFDAQIGPFDIATYRWASGSRSDIMLGFHAGAALLSPSFGVLWFRKLTELVPGGSYPYSDVEVEICDRNNFYMLAMGAEYFVGQDVVRNFARSGTVRWAIDIHRGNVYGAAPPYTGPLGAIDPDHFALGCNEQDLPTLSFQRSEHDVPFRRDIRALTLLHTGGVFRKYRGTFPSGVNFEGAAGIDASAFDFLARGTSKFSLRSRTALGWTSF